MKDEKDKIIYVINPRGERIKLTMVNDGSEMKRQAELFAKEGKAFYEPGYLSYLKFFLAKDKEYGDSIVNKAVEIEPGVYVNSDNVPTVNKFASYLRSKDNKDYFAIGISDVSKLSLREARRIQEKFPQGVCVKISNKNSRVHQEEVHSLDDYIKIMEKFQELTEGINWRMPEKQKFALIYERVAKHITYNHQIVGAKTDPHFNFVKQHAFDGRNYNALITGKGVCSAFSHALETACRLKGIDCVEVGGSIDTIKEKDQPLKNYATKVKELDSGKYVERSYHAWNKVRLDGVWYNVDPTYDRQALRAGGFPNYALMSDLDMVRTGRLGFGGPPCYRTANNKTMRKMFPKVKPDEQRIILVNRELNDKVEKMTPLHHLVFHLRNRSNYNREVFNGILKSYFDLVGRIASSNEKLLPAGSNELEISRKKIEDNRTKRFNEEVQIKGDKLKTVKEKQKEAVDSFLKQNNGAVNKEKDEEIEK